MCTKDKCQCILCFCSFRKDAFTVLCSCGLLRHISDEENTIDELKCLLGNTNSSARIAFEAMEFHHEKSN